MGDGRLWPGVCGTKSGPVAHPPIARPSGVNLAVWRRTAQKGNGRGRPFDAAEIGYRGTAVLGGNQVAGSGPHF
jgi:hypothetical protein